MGSQEPINNSNNNSSAPILPIPGQRNVLITSALPYVNNVPHLGNIIGCVLSADVFARYCRLNGCNTLYIGGTDEYGTATEIKALQENLSPREICDKYHEIHKEIYEWFGISFDHFGRTSTPQQTDVCQSIFNKLWDKNYLSEDTTHQLYCDRCERFLADRYVEGTCPGCNNGSARGDQCDNCPKTYDSTELVDPRCKICGSSTTIRDTEHVFLEFPKLEEKLRSYISEMEANWSGNAIRTTKAWLKEGLKKRNITRDLKWGVPVPLERYKDKVFYVWYDAPIGYISITKCYTPDHWEKWWKNPKDVELYQFMGKDNIPFHTFWFPSILLGTGENWTLMKAVSVAEYLNYESDKFSKSGGVGVFGTDAKDTNIPVEVWRYYLIINRPEKSDSAFKWEDLQAKVNGELVNKLGNFIHRVLSFIAKDDPGYGSVIPDAENVELHPLTQDLGRRVGDLVDEYKAAMEKVKLREGLEKAMSISKEGNHYLQESRFWQLCKQDRPACSIVIRTSVGLVYLLACLLEPFIPSFSAEVRKQLNLPLEIPLSLDDISIERARRLWEFLPRGHRIGSPAPLFKELKDKEIVQLKERFAGSQADRKLKAE
ncbi:OLC1v1000669C1 [Oldenlandia corymbosa var. corymbosa]|uniref:methionine--tRNA ligase n=1 Tax=Oldenlandia corymbosa var. corymbosa TaxID=529605 RepID=A0AAV1D4F8_OLDCO|nr:OLC1v1000669C1 [Oldenlandia corymbosa var. corymbosa]